MCSICYPLFALKRTSELDLWVSLAVFCVVSALAGGGLAYKLDRATILSVQRLASPMLDRIGDFLSNIGDWEITGGLLLFLAVIMALRGSGRLAWRIVAAFLVASLVEFVLKMVLPVPPIPESLGRSAEFSPLIAVDYSYPYPSGHLMRFTVLLGALHLWIGGRITGTLAVFGVVLMGVSRVYLGIHWPSDVVGGTLLGIAAVAWAFETKKEAR